MSKKGMTLIELLVYMAIAALLLAPVIMLMQNSSLNMARDAANTGLHISGNDILSIMYDDIKNTGFKLDNMAYRPELAYFHGYPGQVLTSSTCYGSSFTRCNTDKTDTTKDISSFWPRDGHKVGTKTPGGPYDTLTIRKGRLNRTTGEWLGYDSVKYYVKGDTLMRLSQDSIGANGASNPVTRAIATNVEALQFQYSADLSMWRNGREPGDSLIINTQGADYTSCSHNRPVHNKKMLTKYIKIIIVTIDRKKLAPVKTFPQDTIGNYVYGPFNDQYLREVSEIVVPIPNNGCNPYYAEKDPLWRCPQYD